MRKAFILPLIASILLGTVMISPVGAESTTIGVERSSIVDYSLVPGSNFTVEIWVRNVTDLYVLEFHLRYNTTVLTATLIEYGGIFDSNMFEWGKEIWDDLGWLAYSVSTHPETPVAFNGNGKVAIIHFTVDSVGESVLDLYQTELRDSKGKLIAHGVIDGYFRNALISVTLTKRGAWPEHHCYCGLADEDDSNDLFAIVSNEGGMATRVQVVFTVMYLGQYPAGVFKTPTITLPVGAMYGHDKDARYKVAFIVPPTWLGMYYVTAVCLADTNGDKVPETPMGKVKTFSFEVVPTLH